MPYVLLLKILAVIAMAGGLVFGVHMYNDSMREQGRAEVRSEYAALLEKARSEALEKEAGWRKQQEKSNANHTKRQQVLNANLATANLANSSLLDTLKNIRSSLPGDTPAAVAERATTFSNVLGECSTEVTRLAAISDRWVGEAVRCVESWPK